MVGAVITQVPDEKETLYHSTYGVGEVITTPSEKGCRRFIVVSWTTTVVECSAICYAFLIKRSRSFREL